MVMDCDVAAALVPRGALRRSTRGRAGTATSRLPKRVCPPCGDLAGRLEQQQAAVGVGEVDAPAVGRRG